MCLKIFKFLYAFLVSSSLFLPAALVAEELGYNKAGTITGAGAHFAWVIFDDLKEELEEVSAKKLQLYGKNSNLGMGCNSGIKLAQQHSHSNQTFGFVCCRLSSTELEQKQIKMYPIVDEPILILVNKKNPLTTLSAVQVREIFSGKIKNWNELGGWDKPIVVVARLHCKKRPGHWKTILSDASEFVKKRINVSSATEMVTLVTKFETAIGHTGSTWAFDKKSNVKALRIDNFEANAENLKNKSYPFYRTLSAVTSMNPSEDILKIINRVQQGESIKRVAKKYKVLPLNTD